VYTITVNHRDKGSVVYNIYRQNEADNEEIPYKYWKEADIGEYALSDDGYVALVIQKKVYTGANGVDNTYVRLPWGYSFHTPKYPGKKFNAEGRKSNHTFSGKKQIEVRAGQKPMKDLAVAYSVCWDYDLAIDMVFDSNTPAERRRHKRYMKSEVFKNMVKGELKELLAEKGYTESDVVDLIQDAITMSKEKKDVSNLLRAVENIQDMLGMRDKEIIKTTETLQAHSTRKLLDEITEEEQNLLATKTVTHKTESPQSEEASE